MGLGIWCVWNDFDVQEERYYYRPRQFDLWDIITRKELRGWKFKDFRSRARLTRKACMKICLEWESQI